MNLQISPGRIKVDWRIQLPVIVVALALFTGLPKAQDSGTDARQQRFDEILDANVLDGYIASLANVQLESASPQEQVTFWLNGYNAVVLRTVIDHYPIQRQTREY